MFILKIEKVVENSNSTQVRQQYLRCTIKNTDCLWVFAKFSKSIQICANFTLGMMGNETGHLLKYLELYEKFTNKSETKHMLRKNIAATSLKII